ncbi:MAG: hypothetical protein QXD69_01660 [Candidatus Bathyarchaeia archaeon]
MHKTVFIVGLVILVVGIALTVFGFQYASSLDALLEADEWDVTWYSIVDSYGTWGDVIGSSRFPKNFYYNPISYEDWFDHFGFRAKLYVTLGEDKTVIFRAGSDDGIILIVDGQPVINSWVLRAYAVDETSVFLTAGTHELELWWYEWEGAQAASFEMHVEEWGIATTLQTAGGGIIFIGAIITVIGFILKPRAKVTV